MKFKPGDRIYYIRSDNGEKQYGTVIHVLRSILGSVWAIWEYKEGHSNQGWMPEKECFLEKAKAKRKLPSWF